MKLIVYRRICTVDTHAHTNNQKGISRFVIIDGPYEEIKKQYDVFAASPQVLAVEIVDGSQVIERFDRLIDLIPSLRTTINALRDSLQAVVEPAIYTAMMNQTIGNKLESPPDDGGKNTPTTGDTP